MEQMSYIHYTCTLHSLLEEYFRSEKVNLKCDNCNDGHEATRCNKIGISPNILTITIKRYSFNVAKLQAEKSGRKVMLPNKLKDTRFVLLVMQRHGLYRDCLGTSETK